MNEGIAIIRNNQPNRELFALVSLRFSTTNWCVSDILNIRTIYQAYRINMHMITYAFVLKYLHEYVFF